MTSEPIREGFDVFIHDGDKAVGAVRKVAPHGRPELVIYVENAVDFTVPLTAVAAVESEKVILDYAKLEPRLLTAIGHEHEAEDPRL